jgi:hypothetical protein
MVGGQNWGWRLGRRTETSGGEVAYEVFGEGTPLIFARHAEPFVPLAERGASARGEVPSLRLRPIGFRGV